VTLSASLRFYVRESERPQGVSWRSEGHFAAAKQRGASDVPHSISQQCPPAGRARHLAVLSLARAPLSQSSTTTALNLSTTSSTFGQPVILSATVRPVAPGAGTPTGTVTFYRGRYAHTHTHTHTQVRSKDNAKMDCIALARCTSAARIVRVRYAQSTRVRNTPAHVKWRS